MILLGYRKFAIIPTTLCSAAAPEFWPIYLTRSGCPQGTADRRLEFGKFQELTGKLYRAGVPLLVGTDTRSRVTPGFDAPGWKCWWVGLPGRGTAPPRYATRCAQGKETGSLVAGSSRHRVVDRQSSDDIRNTRKMESVTVVVSSRPKKAEAGPKGRAFVGVCPPPGLPKW
jgi:hypothetical protein